MKKIILILISLMLLIALSYPISLSEKIKEFTLSNGMKFFVYERHQVPTFAGMIMVKVGSIDEDKGETGLAHFFEHMAFKGTTLIGTKDYEKEKVILEEIDKIANLLNEEYSKGKEVDEQKINELKEQLNKLQLEASKYVVKDEIDKIYSENGGEFLNAATSNDFTAYFVMLPSNRLELWFSIESERFKHPVLREFYTERDVIAEERRMWEENDPEGYLTEEFNSIAFLVSPYRHPVVGYMEDIKTHTKDKALTFYKKYYVPNNMMAAIVGDVNLNEVKKFAEKYFGDIPSSNQSLQINNIKEPKQKGERRIKILYDAQPQIMIGYHIPEYFEKDNVILDAISIILTGGKSSRLTKDLVNERKIAVSVSSDNNYPGVRLNSLFVLSAIPRYPNTPEEVEKVVKEHLEKLKKEPPSEKEVKKIINLAEASLYRGMTNNIFLAWRILQGGLLTGNVDAEFNRVNILKTITGNDIMEVANKIFNDSNCTVAILYHKQKEEQ